MKDNLTYKFILTAILFIILAPITACSTPAPVVNLPVLSFQSNQLVKNPPPEEIELHIPVTEDAEWKRIETFTGSGNDTTAPFSISSDMWRIHWAIDSIYPEYTAFDVFVYKQDEQITFRKQFSNHGTDSSGTVSIELDAGTYYIKVIATNLYRWSIAVDDHTIPDTESPVQITHINYKGRGLLESIKEEEDIIEADEYIEISNMSSTPQSISGWRLVNITSGFPTFTFPSYYPFSYAFNSEEKEYTIAPLIPCVLEPYHSVRVYTGEVHYESGGFCYYFLPGNIWNNTEPDTAVLYSSYNKEVSRRSYIVAPLSETDQ
jgi:hypothetical protein